MSNVLNDRLEQLATRMLSATADAERQELIREAKILKEFFAELSEPAKTYKRQEKKQEGRARYSRDNIAIKLVDEIPVTFEYTLWNVEPSKRHTDTVEGVILGFLASGNAQVTAIAIEMAVDCFDLKRGEIYAFQSKSLKKLRRVSDGQQVVL